MSQTATSLTPYLTCRDAAAAVEFYQKAFGADSLHVLWTPDGKIMHACVSIAGAQVFLTEENTQRGMLSPLSMNGTPVSLHLAVPDCDAVFQRAVDAGCTVQMPLQDMFWGDRFGMIRDPFGFEWSIATKVRDVSVEEMQQAANEFCGPPA